MAARPLPNYLVTHRKSWALSQKQLIQLPGLDTCSPLSKYENNHRIPGLKTALACEVVFGEPVEALFPGVRLEVEEEVMRRALVLFERLEHRKDLNGKRQLELVMDMLARATTNPNH